MLIFSWRLTRTVAGRSFMAIREDELAAQAMGISTTFEKVRAFVIGCGLAGVVGAMSAPFLNTWNARQSSFDALRGPVWPMCSSAARAPSGGRSWARSCLSRCPRCCVHSRTPA